MRGHGVDRVRDRATEPGRGFDSQADSQLRAHRRTTTYFRGPEVLNLIVSEPWQASMDARNAVFKTVCGALLRRPGWVRFPSIPANFVTT